MNRLLQTIFNYHFAALRVGCCRPTIVATDYTGCALLYMNGIFVSAKGARPYPTTHQQAVNRA
ncbi:MAG: hypothetical protein KJ069_17415 [Anaerolineae bacterium]|nr:hypothetical protein [Anaerolineae bacterium]